jgi:malonyl CoA-acyl carrier protein transacylase/phosphopantetheinyl transferase
VEQRQQLEQRMHDMDVGSESVFIGGMAMHELLVSLGVQADVMLGHSSGESAALGATGANPAATPLERAACISQHYAAYEQLLQAGKIPTGALLAVGALPPSTVDAQVAAAKDVVVAMDNCSNQMVLYGTPEGIAGIQKTLTELGGMCLPLPFDRGYHTPAFSDASVAFLAYYENVKVGRPKVPLYSCASAGLFPNSAPAVRKLAAAQWSQKVRFRETVLKMHDDGVRIFVEVGPSANLTAFVNDILIDQEYVAVPTNARRKNGVEQLMTALGQLYVAGRGPVLERLFSSRAIARIDLAGTTPPPKGVLLDNTMPMVRLTQDDREQVRRLAKPVEMVVPAPAPAPAPDAAELAETAAEVPAEATAQDGREQVMADYFDMMRGFLDQQRSLVERWPRTAAAPAGETAAPEWPSTHAIDSPTPLLDVIVEHDESHVLARCRVSLLNDNFIRDHVMSGPVSDTDPELFGLSCVPFTVSLEVMAEACALLCGRLDVRVIENVKAFDWVALDNGELTFEVRADVIDRERGHYAARVITARGPVLTAEFRFEADWLVPAVPSLVDRRESCLNSPHMYSTGMFHGPVFQSMTYVEAWDDSGIDVHLSEVSLAHFFAGGHVPRLVLNPVLLDAMGQVVACWLVQYVGTDFHAFPSTIQRIELHETCPSDRAGIVMRMRQRPVDGVSTDIATPRAWQFECVDGEGRVLMRGQDLVNLFFVVPPAYHEVRCDPLNGWFGQALPLLPDADLTLWEVPLMSEEFCAQSGAICLRILAHSVLGPVERDEWRALQGHLRRRREWLFGRAALKEAVRSWVHEQTGRLLYPTDIVVQHDEQGAPFVSGWWCDSLVPAPRVSLSHNANACLVAVAAPDHPVGVDLEELGRIRQPDLMIESLAPAEKHLVQGLQGAALDERVLRLWCAKEAAAKCLGIGLQGQPSAFVVVSGDELCENVYVQHDLGRVEARVMRRDGTIVAVAAQQLSDLELHE